MTSRGILFGFLLIIKLSLLFLVGCREPKVRQDELRIDNQTLVSNNRILIVNSLSENFSMVQIGADGIAHVQKNVPMQAGSENDKSPCGSPNHLHSTQDHLFVTCSRTQTIKTFRKTDLRILSTTFLGNACNPWGSTSTEQEEIFTSCYITNELKNFKMNTTSSDEVRSIDLKVFSKDINSIAPRPNALTIYNDSIYIAMSNLNRDFRPGELGTVAVYNLATRNFERQIQTSGYSTTGVTQGIKGQGFDKSHSLYFVSSGNTNAAFEFVGDGFVDEYSVPDKKIVNSIAIDGAPSLMVIDEEGIAYLSNGKLGVVNMIDLKTNQVLANLDLRPHRCQGNSPLKMTYASSILVNTSHIFVTEFNSDCLLVFNRKDRTFNQRIDVGDGPSVMSFW